MKNSSNSASLYLRLTNQRLRGVQLMGRLNVAALLVALLLVFSSIAQSSEGADEQAAQVSNELNFVQFKVASGNFTQRKYFKVLAKPILSSGELYFEQGLGLLWQTNSPVFSHLLLTTNGLHRADQVSGKQAISGGEVIASVLMNAISGDVNALEQQFLRQQVKEHCVVYAPKLAQWAQVIETIALCGDKSLESGAEKRLTLKRIVINELSGNRTEIDVTINEVIQLSEEVRAQLQ